MSKLTSLTIAEARKGLKEKKFSSLELTEAYLAAMEQARILNAYIVETPGRARPITVRMRTTRSRGIAWSGIVEKGM